MGKRRRKMKIYPTLPEEVIISILVNLQVKPLMRFRCVCKSWYHFIKSPNFIEMHKRSTHNKKYEKNKSILIKHVRNVNHKTVLSFHSCDSLDEIPPHMEVPHFNDNHKYEVSWPCNGLLLCVSVDDLNLTSISVLCNPSTRESKLLPPNPFHDENKPRLSVSLIGLGFDSNQKDYKVITIEYKDKAHIYNLSSNCWREIEYSMPNIDGDGRGVPFKGALYWPAKRNEIDIILCFDVDKEVFEEINLPEDIDHDGEEEYTKTVTITLCCGYPAMVTIKRDKYLINVDIWITEEDRSWMKEASFNGFVKEDIIRPRMFWKGGILFDTHCGGKYWELKLLKYWKLDDSKTIEMNETGICGCFDCLPSVMRYKESLVSIN